MLLSVPERTGKLKWWFFIFLALTVVFMVWMKNLLYPLHSGEIVHFEMAKTTAAAAGIINEWQETGKLNLAIKSIYLDYIFIVLYTVTISLGCQFLSSIAGNEILARTGKLFAILIFAAGIFDVVENIAMTRSLHESITLK